MKKGSKSLAAKIVIIVLFVLILSTAIVGIIGYALNRNDAVELNASKAVALSNSIASAVDPEQFEQALETGEKNDFWYSFKEFVDDVYRENDLFYLYVLDNDYDSEVHYFAEGYDPATGEEEIDLLDSETVDAYSPELFDTIKSGQSSQTGIYDSEGFGYMVSGYAPILDENGAVIGAVGVDLNVDSVVQSANLFGLIIVVIIAALCVAMGFLFRWYVKRFIGDPILDITNAAEQIAVGDTDINLNMESDDEIGALAASFQHMTDSTKHQTSLLEKLAEGDLTVDITPRSDKDIMSISLRKMITNLNRMFGDVKSGTTQVSAGARQMASSAQTLAQGATEQAGTIEQLSRSIEDIAGKTKENADRADQAALLAESIKDNAQKGSDQMEAMIKAVHEINEASLSINKVIKVIDDIAFQTNILALNAAVEASRAGEHGRGFAVVAEEVRNLAQKSSESAKDTSALIEDSMKKTSLGVKIADDTHASLAEIVSGINESSRLVSEIAKSSEDQSEAIQQVNDGIDQVAQVVQQNSATSEESAASSEEMSSQASMLENLVSRFKIKS